MSDYLLSLAYELGESNPYADIFDLMEYMMEKEKLEKEKERDNQNE